MKTISKLKYVVLVVISVFAFSCEGEDGDQGLQGPVGEKGEEGLQGPAGEKGEEGNANVIASDWISWSPASGANGDNIDLNDESITQEVLDSSLIMVYGGLSDKIRVLPFQEITSTTNSISYKYTVSVGKIRVNVKNSEFGVNFPLNFFINKFRFVIIPSSNSTTTASAKVINSSLEEKGVDYSDYEQVVTHFGLED